MPAHWTETSKTTHTLTLGATPLATACTDGAWTIEVPERKQRVNQKMSTAGQHKADAVTARMTQKQQAEFLLEAAKRAVHKTLDRYGWGADLPASLDPAKKTPKKKEA